MMPLWNHTASEVKAKVKEDLREAEAKLLKYSRNFGHNKKSNIKNKNNNIDYQEKRDDKYFGTCIRTFDTKIPRSVVPLHDSITMESPNNFYSGYCASHMNVLGDDDGYDSDDQNDELTIHGIKIVSSNSGNHNDNNTSKTEIPLVLLHGYMNASAYFYRNFLGLSQQYYQTIYSLDLLGWGLSSRPTFRLKDDRVETAEAFFVESLEAWRKSHGVARMILAGHSMGGYISVAYCERYPQYVDRLILLSPVGIQDPKEDVLKNNREKVNSSLRGRAFRFFFDTFSVGEFFRSMPYFHSLTLCQNYVERRLGTIFNNQDHHHPTAISAATATNNSSKRIPMTKEQEQDAVTAYLHSNIVLKGSGEYCLNRFLTSNIAGKKPLKYRIPKLNIREISILYGTSDWMDSNGGLMTQKMCNDLRRQQQQPFNNSNNIDSSALVAQPPTITIYSVRDAGHLLMLENWKEFNACVIHAGGGHFIMNDKSLLPILINHGGGTASKNRSRSLQKRQ